jgi:hypothetical protein
VLNVVGPVLHFSLTQRPRSDVVVRPTKAEQAGCQWLTPVIIATWEPEVGKIMV